MITDTFGTLIQGDDGPWLIGKPNYSKWPMGPMKFPKGPVPGSFTPEEADAYLAGLVANPVLALPSPGWLSRMTWEKIEITALPGRSGYHFGEVDFQDQPDKPSDPGVRETSANNSFGNVIPISFGKRRLPGTVIQSSALVPRLIGTRTYSITYQIPIYEDKSTEGPPVGTIVDSGGTGRPRPDPDNPGNECGEGDPCNPTEEPGFVTYWMVNTETCDSEGNFGPQTHSGHFTTSEAAITVAQAGATPNTRTSVVQAMPDGSFTGGGGFGGEDCLL